MVRGLRSPTPSRALPVICLIGVDGVGKTTQAEALAAHLAASGQPSEVVWLRFSHVRSLPVLVLARLLGVSTMRRIGEHRIGRHDWWRARWLGRLYARTLAWDLRSAARRRLGPALAKGRRVVCDRFAHDAVVDLAVAFRDPDFAATPAARRLLATPPRRRVVILLDPGQGDRTSARRPDLALDPDRPARIAAYRRLAERLGLPVVDASLSVEAVQRSVQALVDSGRSTA